MAASAMLDLLQLCLERVQKEYFVVFTVCKIMTNRCRSFDSNNANFDVLRVWL